MNAGEEVEVRLPNPIGKTDANHAVYNIYQFGVPNVQEKVELNILGAIVDRPTFDFLRTKHQLGYIVAGGVRSHLNVAEFLVLVQGTVKTPDEVELLIDELIGDEFGSGSDGMLLKQILEMGGDEFGKRKESLLSKLKKPPTNIGEVSGDEWGQIWNEWHCFDMKQKMATYLEGVSDKDGPLVLASIWRKFMQRGVDR